RDGQEQRLAEDLAEACRDVGGAGGDRTGPTPGAGRVGDGDYRFIERRPGDERREILGAAVCERSERGELRRSSARERLRAGGDGDRSDDGRGDVDGHGPAEGAAGGGEDRSTGGD